MTDTVDIVTSIRVLIDERDALRVRVAEIEALAQRQGIVIGKAASLLRELDAFAGEVSAQWPDPADARPKTSPRYTLEDGRRWLALMRDGATLVGVSSATGVSITSVRNWVRKAGGVVEEGRLVSFREPDAAPVDEEPASPPFSHPSRGSAVAAAASSWTRPGAPGTTTPDS